MNWYNTVSRNLDKIPECIAYFDKELIEAKKQCKIYGSLEKASAALPGIVEQRFSQLQQLEAILEYLNIEQRRLRSQTFKKFLENYSSPRGEGMVEVDKEIKNDKMIELKEAIKNEVRDLLKEDEKKSSIKEDEKEPSKKDVKKAGMSLSKTKDKLVKLKDKKQSLMDKRKKMFGDYKDKIQGLDPDKAKKEFDKYAKKQEPVTKEIKDIEAEMKSLEKTLEEARMDEREMRRNAAKTMMGKDVHMEILNIVKEAGISLKEGSDGVKIYYEIAKTAYMEGLTAGMKSNI